MTYEEKKTKFIKLKREIAEGSKSINNIEDELGLIAKLFTTEELIQLVKELG